MIYRHATKDDFKAIDALCMRYGIATPPDPSTTLIAVDETGEVRGILGMRIRLVVEPFISESGIASAVLWEKMKTASEILGHQVLLLTTKDAHAEQAERLGFKVLNKDVIVMEKE